MKESKSPFVKGKKLSEYTEEEINQIIEASSTKSQRKGFFEGMHVSYRQNEIDQAWLNFHSQDDEYSYPIPKCNTCGKQLGTGDYRDGHYPYHQEYNACKEHKDDYSNSINNNTDS